MAGEVTPSGKSLAASAAGEGLDRSLWGRCCLGHAHVGGRPRKDHGDGGSCNVLLLLLSVARHGHGHRRSVHGVGRRIGPRHVIKGRTRGRVARMLRAVRRTSTIHGGFRQISRRQLGQLWDLAIRSDSRAVVWLLHSRHAVLIHDIPNVHEAQ